MIIEYTVGVAHGQGPVSTIHPVGKSFFTVEDANAAAKKWAAANPECNGWNAHVGVCVWNAERREWEWVA